MKRLLLFLLIALNLFPLSVNALSPEQRRIFNSGVYYFDIEACEPAINTGYVANANNNEETVFWFFVSKGYTKEQVAGILGNMWVESPQIEPRKVQYGTLNSRGEISRQGQPSSIDDMPARGGYGIVQWTPGTKILPDAQARSKPPGDLMFQLELIYDQLEGRSQIPEKRAGDHLKQQITVREATASFMLKYERPRDQSQSAIDKRVRVAERVYQNFLGKTPPAGIQVTASGGNVCPPSGLAGTEQIIDGFVVYNQNDPAWRNKPFGTSTIGRSGCGPSAVAMIASTFGTKVTPDQVAARFGHFHVSGVGSSWGLMIEGPRAYGLTSVDIGTNITKATEELRQGALILATGKGPKPFTTGGHILVLRGITADGKILVGDSGHDDTSEVEWSPEQLTGSIRNMWVVKK